MTWRPEAAMVLAAGLGTRMRPLTDQVPKPLVRLGGRALIDHALDRIADAGIRRAVVNVHYMADKIEAHVRSRKSPRIEISDERDLLLDTGGGVVRALPRFGDKAFLVHNSDSVWIEGVGSNLARLADAWDETRMDFLLLVALSSLSLGYDGQGDFVLDASGTLKRRPERQQSPFVFTGVSIAHPRAFRDAPQGAFSLNRLWDRAIDAGRLYGVRMEGLWMHVGTPAALDEAEKALGRDDNA